MSESEEYLFAKPVYSGTYPPIEGDADAPYANFFKDKEGNTGFIVSDGISASIIFGDNVIKTDYYDIEASSFVYDKNGELTYVAKNGAQFYTAPGNEFVVQGSKRHAAFDNVYIPVQFNSKNEPVYTGAEFLADIINNYFLVIGSEKQPVYKDAAKKERGEEFNGGLYEIKIDASDNISYYGSIYEEMMDSREGGFVKTSYVVNNVRGKFYYGLGLWKFYGSEALNTFNPNKDYYTTALIHRKAGKDNVLDEKYGSIPDYGFNNAGKIYYVGLMEGDYDKKVKPEYFVYIDGLLAGKYETILFEGIGDNYNMILFDSRDNYAYAVSTFNYYEEGDEIVENSAYVITNKGKQDPQILSGDAKKDFDYIESMFYTANDRLFYIGGINDYPANKYYSEIIVDGQNLGKVYTGVSNFRYDKEANTVSFYGARGNTLYKVNVSF